MIIVSGKIFIRRGEGPSGEQLALITGADVRRHLIASSGSA